MIWNLRFGSIRRDQESWKFEIENFTGSLLRDTKIYYK
jgi:hypothetical protein